MNKQERIEAAKVGEYQLSLTKMLGKTIADVTGYITQEFGDRSFKVCELKFTDGTSLGFEGEHDHPYVVDGCGDNPAELSEELLEAFDEDAADQDESDDEGLMTTTITYTFTDEDAPRDVIAAVRAPELQRAVSAYARWLRENDKYGDGTPVDFAEIREHFRVFMVERG